ELRRHGALTAEEDPAILLLVALDDELERRVWVLRPVVRRARVDHVAARRGAGESHLERDAAARRARPALHRPEVDDAVRVRPSGDAARREARGVRERAAARGGPPTRRYGAAGALELAAHDRLEHRLNAAGGGGVTVARSDA